MNPIRTALFLATALACLATSARADYPIASHRYLADPSVLVHEGRVYLYCSNDNENIGSSEYVMQSLVCVSSDDLKNWTDHGVVFQVPRDASWANLSWAPAAAARNGKIYLYFSNGASNIGVATGDSPIGPFTDPIGGPLVDHSTPGATGANMWLFDPYAFIDDDGQAYLYFGGNAENNGRVIKLNEDMVSVDGAAQSITAPGFFEAAYMHKRDGIYYFSYSTNPANGLRIDYMTSDNPVSGFEYAGIVAGQPPSNNNNNHAGNFEFEGNWYHVFHNRFVANESGDPPGYLRNLGLEPLYYNEDGSIQLVEHRRESVAQVKPLDPYQPVEGETFAAQNGIETEACQEGGLNLTAISDGDWVQLRGVDFGSGAGRFAARVASETGGAIEIRLDRLDGPLAGLSQVPSTGGVQEWQDATATVDPELAQGERDLYLVFTGEGDELFNLNWWSFQARPSPPAGLAALIRSSSEIELSWSPSEAAASYTLLRASDPEGEYTPLAENLSQTHYNDTGLSKDAVYYYAVVASGETGSSLVSEPIEASPKFNYNEWVSETFPDSADEEQTAPEADPDRDGRPNLLEYYMATHPLLPDRGSFRIERSGPGQFLLTYRQSRELASTQATIEKSADLGNWTRIEQSATASAETEAYTVMQTTIETDDDALYLRLAARQLP